MKSLKHGFATETSQNGNVIIDIYMSHMFNIQLNAIPVFWAIVQKSSFSNIRKLSLCSVLD